MSEKIFQHQFGKDALIIKTGELAKQADGAVLVQYGGTVVLVTAVMSKKDAQQSDFMPLTVEYQEKTYAAGKIPGGFFKREGRPSENAILTARLIDRPIRPLFPEGFFNEVQIMAIVLSCDGENDPDIFSVIGASCALHISGIPFLGPLGACKVAFVKDKGHILNPTYLESQEADFEVTLVGTEKGVIMIEARAQETPEDKVLEAIAFGTPFLNEIIALQKKIAQELGTKKFDVTLLKIPDTLREALAKDAGAAIKDAVANMSAKEERIEAMETLRKTMIEKYVTEDSGFTESQVKIALDQIEKKLVREMILREKKRPDARGLDEIRPLSCKVGVLPRTHGSAIFTRGQTQSLVVSTLGTRADEQMIDALEGESFKTFMLHYSFPPFSVGETRPVRGPGRREIGHGALAEKALKAVMPKKEDFPYTVRVVSEILESNGSSSMATVCGGTLSLMDAGVPLIRPVAGISIGMVRENGSCELLTDIMGLEDHFGDMDFKITGTSHGITAIQLDLKTDGISIDIIRKAFEQAKRAREVILAKMAETIPEPRKEVSVYAPKIVVVKIDPLKIGEVIGPGGRVIKKIIEQTQANIDIDDDGSVYVSSMSAESLNKAVEIIKGMTQEVEVGQIYEGPVKRLMNFGAFVEILPGKEGLVHISEFSDTFVKNIEDVAKIGDIVKVKVIEIDAMGRINLSRKQLLPGAEKTEHHHSHRRPPRRDKK
jgi:polyribonucleotide nucleotidyltransferase